MPRKATSTMQFKILGSSLNPTLTFTNGRPASGVTDLMPVVSERESRKRQGSPTKKAQLGY